MSKKDFELIARVLDGQRARSNTSELWRLDETARAFASELASTNPRFDRAHFLRACGVEA